MFDKKEEKEKLKGEAMIIREEEEIPLTNEEYQALLEQYYDEGPGTSAPVEPELTKSEKDKKK